uniref:Lipase domain-containing protein n=1 Tax=Clastoptera arizonana TaxID=38151 RepID=A0A1B6C008_9HEMI
MKCVWFIVAQLTIVSVVRTSGNVIDYFRGTGNCIRAPSTCPNENIVFYLYTRDTQNNPQVLDPSNIETIKNAKFIEGAELKVLVHGYTGNKDYAPNPELRAAYFQQGEYNIITVDWGALAQSPCYLEAAYNVKDVGICASQLLELVYANNPAVTLDNTHVIGFSLGAHVAGVLGSSLTSGKLPRLTGLDAALPLFDKVINDKSEIIDSEDAEFVDAYHTNQGQRGRVSTFGTVDFYINNGAYQPGCNCNSSCSHYRAVEYFAESINSEVGFYGTKCISWYLLKYGFCNVNELESLVLMGENISYNLTGVYYSFTNDRKPYAISAGRYYDVDIETDRVDINCGFL